eukprot:scaffold13100_cov33-Phaeocystis_antarctica.AAC.1
MSFVPRGVCINVVNGTRQPHIVARSLQERRIALLMRGASPRRRAPAATCYPEPRLCRLQARQVSDGRHGSPEVA